MHIFSFIYNSTSKENVASYGTGRNDRLVPKCYKLFFTDFLIYFILNPEGIPTEIKKNYS